MCQHSERKCRLEPVLLQNALLDIARDELATLGDDDPQTSGQQTDSTLTELQSFVDLSYTHGRCVTAIQWLPHRKVLTMLVTCSGCCTLQLLIQSHFHLGLHMAL